MLEPLVQQYLAQQALLAGIKAEKATALEPLRMQVAAIEKDYDTYAVDSKIALLKAEILEKMEEKTYKLGCATISKRITKRLKVSDGNALYEQLRVMPAVLAKVIHSFTKCKIIDLVDAGALTLGSEAEITTTETLVVKPN